MDKPPYHSLMQPAGGYHMPALGTPWMASSWVGLVAQARAPHAEEGCQAATPLLMKKHEPDQLELL